MKETVVVVSLDWGIGSKGQTLLETVVGNSCCFDQDWGIGRQARVKVPLNENKEKQEQVLKPCLLCDSEICRPVNNLRWSLNVH